MKNRCLIFTLATVLGSCSAVAQSSTINGRIVDKNGEPVEYATVCMAGSSVGTLSGADGSFTLKVPEGCCDTVSFSHVSFETEKVAVTNLLYKSATVRMQARALNEAVIFDGEKKRGKLMSKGMRVAGARTMWTPESIGEEIGSVVETKNVFKIEEISFGIISNGIKGLRLSVNIYSVDEDKQYFNNIIQTPVYVDVPVVSNKQKITTKPIKQIFLEPGRYFVALRMVDCDKKTKDVWDNSSQWDKAQRFEMSRQSLFFPLYLKESFVRKGVDDEPKEVPVNIGLRIKGLEYKK